MQSIRWISPVMARALFLHALKATARRWFFRIPAYPVNGAPLLSQSTIFVSFLCVAIVPRR